jgi:hypothetical protein
MKNDVSVSLGKGRGGERGVEKKGSVTHQLQKLITLPNTTNQGSACAQLEVLSRQYMCIILFFFLFFFSI